MITLKIQLFGGRGAKSYITKRVPNYKEAKVYNSKITDYILKDKSKNKPFLELGYNNKNSKRLVQELKNGLKKNAVISKKLNEVGRYNYRVDMTIKGVDGEKTLRIKTIWEVDKKNTHLVSAMKLRK